MKKMETVQMAKQVAKMKEVPKTMPKVVSTAPPTTMIQMPMEARVEMTLEMTHGDSSAAVAAATLDAPAGDGVSPPSLDVAVAPAIQQKEVLASLERKC